MIKNIVFDMGNVILSYNPQYIIEHFTAENELQAALINGIFNTKEWLALDSGDISFEDACIKMKERLTPELAPLVDKVMNEWYHHLPVIKGMDELISELKEKGLHIYLLSNTSLSFYQYYQSLPIFTLFDGLYVSADHHLLKPNPEIFKHFCKQHSLNPEECFFVDDISTNVESAKTIGMQGICFNGNQDHPHMIAKAIKRQLR